MSEPKYMARGTKIIATIGPASSSYDQIHALMHEGVDVFRLNFSHGSHEDHLQVIRHINALNEKHEFSVGILADLQGPKIRVSEVENGAMALEEGQIVNIYGGKEISKNGRLYIGYDELARDMHKGERIMIDDGKILLEVKNVRKDKNCVEALVKFGGIVKPYKGVNFPDTDLSLPSLTEKDLNLGRL